MVAGCGFLETFAYDFWVPSVRGEAALLGDLLHGMILTTFWARFVWLTGGGFSETLHTTFPAEPPDAGKPQEKLNEKMKRRAWSGRPWMG